MEKELCSRIKSICNAWPDFTPTVDLVDTVDKPFIRIEGHDELFGKVVINVKNKSMSEETEEWTIHMEYGSSIKGLDKNMTADSVGKMLLKVGKMIQQFYNH